MLPSSLNFCMSLVRSWLAFCNEHGWLCSLVHLSNDNLALWEGLGLRTVKIGRRRYVRPADLAAFIDALADTPRPAA